MYMADYCEVAVARAKVPNYLSNPSVPPRDPAPPSRAVPEVETRSGIPEETPSPLAAQGEMATLSAGEERDGLEGTFGTDESPPPRFLG